MEPTTSLAPAPPAERPVVTLVCPPPAVAAAAARARGPDPLERTRDAVAGVFHRRHVGPDTLIISAFALAALGGFLLLAGHPGLGAVLGLLSLPFQPLATVRPPWPHVRSDLVRYITPACDLLLLAGAFGGIAGVHSPFVVGLAMTAVVLVAWLPSIEPRRQGAPVTGTVGLWTRHEQMAVLLLGLFLARPAPAMFFLVLVCGTDAWLRAAPPPSLVSGQSWARPLFRGDGSLRPLARWTGIAVVVASLFLFPMTTLWRV